MINYKDIFRKQEC